MTFQVQRFSAGHHIESTDIHKRVVAINNGLSLGTRVADAERDAYLYTLSVNAYEDRPPGHYVLLLRGQRIDVDAYEKGIDGPGGTQAVRFVVHAIRPQNECTIPEDELLRILREALETRGLCGVTPTTRVVIEFKNSLVQQSEEEHDLSGPTHQ